MTGGHVTCAMTHSEKEEECGHQKSPKVLIFLRQKTKTGMAFPTIYFGNDQSYYFSRTNDLPHVTFMASGKQVLQMGTTSIQMGTSDQPVQQTVTGIQRVMGQSTFDQPIVSLSGIRLGSTSGAVTITPTELLTLSGVTDSIQSQLTSVSSDVTSNYVTLGTAQSITNVKTFQTAPALVSGITLGSTAISAQTLSYLKNVTSDIQNQIDILSASQSNTSSNSVTLSGTQTITGIKTFTMAPYFNGGAFFSTAPTLVTGLMVGTTAVTNAKLLHINGLRSDVQFQLDTHETDITHLEDTVVTLGDDQTIAGAKVFEAPIEMDDGIIVNASAGPITLTNDELGCLNGATSNLQDQIDTLQTSYTTLGTTQTLTGIKTFQAAPIFPAGLSNGTVALGASVIGCLSGLTSNVQQQLDTISDRAAASANAAGGASGSTFPISGAGTSTLLLGSTSNVTTANSSIGTVRFSNNGNTVATIRSIVETTNDLTSGALVLSTSNSGVLSERLRITNSGNVGINKSIPQYPLDVTGDINFSGNLYRDGTLFSSTGIGQANGTVVGTKEFRVNDVTDDDSNPDLWIDDEKVTIEMVHADITMAQVILHGTGIEDDTVAQYLRGSRSDLSVDNDFTVVFTFYDGMHTKGVELTITEESDGTITVYQSDAIFWMGPIIEFTTVGLTSIFTSHPGTYTVSTLRLLIETESLPTWKANPVNDLYYIDGRIGIGTTTPGYTLDVKGNVNFSGNLYQNGQIFVSSGGSGGGGAGGSSQLNMVKQWSLPSVSTSLSSRTSLVTDGSATLVQIYQNAPFASVLLNGSFISKDTIATYLRGSQTAIVSNSFRIMYHFWDGNFTKAVELTFRDTGTVIDVVQTDSVYWQGRVFDYTTNGLTSIFTSSPTGYSVSKLTIEAYVTTTIAAGGYGLVGVKELSVGTTISLDTANRTILGTDSSLTLSQVYNNIPFANVLLNGSYIVNDTVATFLRGSRSSWTAGATSFTVVFAFFDGGYTKGVELTVSQSGSTIFLYQSNSMYWPGEVTQYTTNGLTSIYVSEPTGYQVSYFRMHVNTTGSSNWAPVGTTASDLSYTSGNVGIGTSSWDNQYKFMVRNTGYGIAHTDGTTTLSSWVGVGSIGTGGGWLGTVTNHPLVFYTNNSGSKMYIGTTGMVGIGSGNTNPRCELSVGSDGDINGTGFLPGVSMKTTASSQRAFSVGQTDTNNIFMTYIYNANAASSFGVLETYAGFNPLILQRQGNIGVGLHPSPFAKLTILDGESLYVGNTISSAFRFHHSTSHQSFLDFGSGNMLIRSSTGIGTEVDRMVITNTGNIGIGTASPSTRLHLYEYGTCVLTLQTSTVDYSSLVATNEYVFMGANWNASGVRGNGARGSSQIVCYHPVGGGFITLLTSPAINTDLIERMRITSNGNIGIGTASPSTTLHVRGNQRIDLPGASGNSCLEIHGTETGTQEYNLIAAGHGGTTTFVLRGNGYIGMGTEAPVSLMHLQSASWSQPLLTIDAGTSGTSAPNGIGQPLVSLGNTSWKNNTSDYYGIGFGWRNPFSTFSPAEIGFITSTTSGNTYGSLVFSTRNVTSNTVASERMRITSTGNVGIGAPNPQARLQIGNTDTNNVGDLIIASSNGLGSNRAARFAYDANYNFCIGDHGYEGGYSFTPQLSMAYSAPSYCLNINSSGNVGIGTLNPSSKLTVSGSVLANSMHAFGSGSCMFTKTVGSGESFMWMGPMNSSIAGGVEVYLQRTNANADWTSTTVVMQYKVDASYFSWLRFQNSGVVISDLFVNNSFSTPFGSVSGGGDNCKLLFGPNTSWDSYLSVGAGPSAVTTNTAQVITTNGNLHLDAALGRQLYLNHYPYLAGNVGGIMSYGPWNHYNSSGTHRFSVTGDGKFGWNTSSPAGIFQVNGTGSIASTILVTNASADDAGTISLLSTQNYASLPYSMSGTNMYFYATLGSTPYRIIQAASTYFTGQHANQPIPEQEYIKTHLRDHVGLIVSSADQGCYSINPVTKEVITGKAAITISESLPYIKLTDKDKDKAVWGVITNVKNDNYNTDGTADTDESTEWNDRLDTMVRVNGLGEGAIWVTNINGPIENGDYICSSPIPGYGRRQDDDLLHNYTVAKVTMSCSFDVNSPDYICEEMEHNGSTYRKAFLPCTYHCS